MAVQEDQADCVCRSSVVASPWGHRGVAGTIPARAFRADKGTWRRWNCRQPG